MTEVKKEGHYPGWNLISMLYDHVFKCITTYLENKNVILGDSSGGIVLNDG